MKSSKMSSGSRLPLRCGRWPAPLRASCPTWGRTSGVELDPPLLPHGDVAGQGDHGVGQGDLATAAGLVVLVVVVVRGVAVADAVGEVLELLAIAARGVGGGQAPQRRGGRAGPAVLGLASITGLPPAPFSTETLVVPRGVGVARLLVEQDLLLLPRRSSCPREPITISP